MNDIVGCKFRFRSLSTVKGERHRPSESSHDCWFGVCPLEVGFKQIHIWSALCSSRRCVLLLTLIGATFLLDPARLAHAGDDWLPVDPTELKMTSEPGRRELRPLSVPPGGPG